MPNVGERKAMVCKNTGKPVLMEYTGLDTEDGKENGHKGWLCLHNEDEEDDAKDVRAYNAGYHSV